MEKIIEKPVEKIVYLPRKHPLDDFDFTLFIKSLDLATFHTEKLKKEWDELFAALKLLNYRKAYNMNERLHVANWNLQRYKPLFEKFKAAQPHLEGLDLL
ncbi:hypothetical protein FHQ26_11720 [Testudinibacter sp. TR-2022]|uniref:hypothetical protein n=1 Tax=Testudinibacter sp. TR-2022 TaxID=2585029 RepID=UPI00111A4EF4|nr:hypothetical protein [Testudinibacter sp. TR-2022]TNH05598.1 hypothetical protein FHQ26_11720 [Testudinibacter sp. TR-2022]TNH14478.1 hypothetical protein FHQ23_11055 [Testudinibacter sp. TR-2022]TNH15473.1 hypothetical protein FIA56_03335 [Testudinibacter sp. TR-2022]